MSHTEPIIRLTAGQVMERFGIKERQLHAWIASGYFPPPDIRLRAGRRLWNLDTVNAFERRLALVK